MITDFKSYLFQQTRAAEEEVNRLEEVVVGVVTDIKDEGKLCRVQVKFPFLPDGSEKAAWATVVMMGAGKDRGWFTLPEKDDEVLVMFEHGDIDRPIVIGALWNGKDKAPDNNADGKNARRSWKSKSGHKVILEDVEGFISIEDGGGIGTVKIDAKNNKIEITAKQGDVGVQCKTDMTILAGEIEITGKGNVDLMGKSTGVDASATATVKIDGNMVALKGSTIDINPGGVPKAAKASGDVKDVADPIKG